MNQLKILIYEFLEIYKSRNGTKYNCQFLMKNLMQIFIFVAKLPVKNMKFLKKEEKKRNLSQAQKVEFYSNIHIVPEKI